ncbi:MAG: hypothetical protein WBB23_25565 [Desulforhopalus sp.]
MYQITGKILNLFSNPATEKYEASHNVQLLGDSLTADGQVKNSLVTLKVPKPVFDSLLGQQGKDATFPIGLYVNKSGQLITFFLKSEAGNVALSA